LENKDELLKEKELDERDVGTPRGTDTEVNVGEEKGDRPDTARKIADSGHAGKDGGEERDRADETDGISSSTHKSTKAAKKISRKELLKLISKKNDILLGMEKEIKKQKEELKIKEDRLLRIAAEFENYKKRTRREWELLEQKAKAELITDILGVLDDFDRALEALGERDDHVADGVILIVTGLKDILMRTGLREIDALGQRFDPQFHEAVGGVESEEVEEGFIAHVVQKGYELNEQLLRPAKVIVSKK
jgi:molecular chaperone GrpE